MKKRLLTTTLAGLLLLAGGVAVYAAGTRLNLNSEYEVGQPIDALNDVAIYYNGGVNTVQGRNLTADGYNLGLRYQCVEFVKRYYFERYEHRMPDTYGHARDFFNTKLKDGEFNPQRAMLQFANGSIERPAADDLIVFSPSLFNRYGHVAIIASVGSDSVEIAQQNPGPFGSSREQLPLVQRDGRWHIDNSRIMGWLRLPDQSEQAPTTEI